MSQITKWPVPDYQIQAEFFIFFWHKNTNRCGMSPLGIISTFFLLVWLENILGISEKSNVLDRYRNKSQKSKLQKMSQITQIHPIYLSIYLSIY